MNDAAIGMAYVMVTLCTDENTTRGFDADGPHQAVQGATNFVKGLLSQTELTDDERRALPHLSAARLATSFTLGWFSYQESLKSNPNMPQERRDYLLHHALPAGNALRILLDAQKHTKFA